VNAGGRRFRVVKLGGSLLDWPGCIPRLRAFLAESKPHCTLLVVGGGGAADWIRRLDRIHRLPVEAGHWLAIETMRLNAGCVASLLPGSQIVKELGQCEHAWSQQLLPILDPVPFCQWDVTQSDGLPIGWEVTSDSIAAQVAWRWQAEELVLIKSCPKPSGDWQTVARTGAVDAYFPNLAQRVPIVRWLCWRGETAE
jgi:aspartokinase-like uncharacterized kinase